jgi:hypothetical protein
VPIDFLWVVFDDCEFLVNDTTIADKYFASAAHAKSQNKPFVPPALSYFDTLFLVLGFVRGVREGSVTTPSISASVHILLTVQALTSAKVVISLIADPVAGVVE